MLSEWVDFHYEVDGKTYDYSMPGGGFAGFTKLAEALGILDEAKKEDAAAFVAEIDNIEFSDPAWSGSERLIPKLQ